MLTPVGRELHAIAGKLLGDIDDAILHIDDIVAGIEGSLVVAASPSVMAGLVPYALADFRQTHPRIKVRLHEEIFERSILMLRERLADVAMTAHKEEADDLVQQDLFEDSLVLVCPSQHALARRASIRWQDIVRYDQIALKSASNVRQLIDQEHLRHGTASTPLYEVERVSSMVGFIAAGHGVGILPYSLIRTFEGGGLACRRIADASLSRTLCVSRLKDISPSPPAQAFIETCVRAAARLSVPGD